ncbi:MAG: putative ABC transporter permease subunit [Burkholderiales bacterium]
MRKVLLLVRIFLKSGGGLISGKNKKAKYLLPLVLLFAFGTFAFSMVFFAVEIYNGLAPFNAQNIILPLVFGATSIVIFLFGIFYVISIMYHADDVEQMKYMPLKVYHILGAKFILLVIYEYIFEAFILAPVLVAYGIMSGAGAAYIIYSVILFLITPVIALSMAALLVMIVMRFTSFGKNKQAFTFIGGILAMALAIGFNVVVQSFAGQISDAALMEAFRNSTLPDILSSIFPGIGFASKALLESATLEGLWNLLLFALCTAGAAIVFMIAGRLLYLKGVSGITETSAKRRAIKDLGRETESTSALRAYFKKELRLLYRSPIAFMNCVLMTFIWPVIILIMMFSGGGKAEAFAYLISQMNDGLLLAVLVGASAFIASSIPITSTAISREGKSLYFTKYIPMSMRKQLRAKAYSGMLFSGISILLLMLVGILMGASITVSIAAFVIGMIAMAAISYAGLLIDVGNPKLEWINEQQAIKQNLNSVLSMLVGVLFGAIAIVPAAVFNTSLAVSAAYCLVFFLAMLLILRSRANTRAVDKLIEMDI